ncbi:hypothetical protein CPC08DRAFT_770760 [Agrocybe pediades]|nr:hypothetical protein CPC08DRAFT_770760 [Agrocybe pediades]
MDARHLLQALSEHPRLSHISLETLLRFIRFALLAKPTIHFHTVDGRRPLAIPPLSIQLLLSQCTGVDIETTKVLWGGLKDVVWSLREVSDPSEEEIMEYNKYALPLGTCYHHLYPPVRVCQTKGCGNHREDNDVRTLGDPITYKGSLFTLRKGALPVYTSSLYCFKCNRRYHLNYAVHAQSDTEEYYAGVPSVIQTSKHHFLDTALLEYVTYSMVFGWLSARNLARIYNLSIGSLQSVHRNNERAFGPFFPCLNLHIDHWQTSLNL